MLMVTDDVLSTQVKCIKKTKKFRILYFSLMNVGKHTIVSNMFIPANQFFLKKRNHLVAISTRWHFVCIDWIHYMFFANDIIIMRIFNM